MVRKLFIGIAAGIGTLVFVTPAVGGDEPAERSEVVVLEEETRHDPVALVYAWSYHPGDDPAWADPSFDDSGWPLVTPSLQTAETVPGGWPGIGWFRRRLRMTAGFGDQLGVHILQAGASEIYLDGRLVASFGVVSADPQIEVPFVPLHVASFPVTPDVEHVLAVRYSNVTGNVLKRNFRGFELRVGEVQNLSGLGLRMIRQYSTFAGMLVGVFGAFTLLHLLLFAFHPKTTENLFFAIFTGSFVGMTLAEIKMESLSELARVLFYYKWFMTGTLAMALAALLVELRVFKRRVGPLFYLLATGSAVALAWVWTRPAFGGLIPVVVYLSLVYLVTLWHAVVALAARRPDAWVIGLGFLILTLSIFALIFLGAGWIEIPPWLPAVTGLGALTLSFSLYLTRRVARTNRELETRLHEVESLTAKTIEQERRAAAEEAERRLLEADNARKTAELEEARALQLAMLPREVPRLEHYQVAVHMSTANEVGGDYYDFSANGDGSCTLVVGDATGHGLHAGMVVGVAKSLFLNSCHDPDLSSVLERIGTGLNNLHHRQASMAIVLVRLLPRRLLIASAGMPPLLVWRADGEKIEEVLVPNVPLGTLAQSRFEQTSVDLSADDAVLIMTDGLAEVTDTAGDPLGYERAHQLFARVAHLEPQRAIERLLELADAYHVDTPLEDDMTLVVLKARG